MLLRDYLHGRPCVLQVDLQRLDDPVLPVSVVADVGGLVAPAAILKPPLDGVRIHEAAPESVPEHVAVRQVFDLLPRGEVRAQASPEQTRRFLGRYLELLDAAGAQELVPVVARLMVLQLVEDALQGLDAALQVLYVDSYQISPPHCIIYPPAAFG